uniref:Uncharacterized protein n=1 Tax=Arundo donax TaxID=35708 RepID=A0A0A8ZZI8_ARUDO
MFFVRFWILPLKYNITSFQVLTRVFFPLHKENVEFLRKM